MSEQQEETKKDDEEIVEEGEATNEKIVAGEEIVEETQEDVVKDTETKEPSKRKKVAADAPWKDRMWEGAFVCTAQASSQQIQYLTQTYAAVFTTFWPLGLVAFGGPQAHIAILRDHLVEQRDWLDEEQFTELFAIGQVRSIRAHSICAYTYILCDTARISVFRIGRNSLPTTHPLTLPSITLLQPGFTWPHQHAVGHLHCTLQSRTLGWSASILSMESTGSRCADNVW